MKDTVAPAPVAAEALVSLAGGAVGVCEGGVACVVPAPTAAVLQVKPTYSSAATPAATAAGPSSSPFQPHLHAQPDSQGGTPRTSACLGVRTRGSSKEVVGVSVSSAATHPATPTATTTGVNALPTFCDTETRLYHRPVHSGVRGRASVSG